MEKAPVPRHTSLVNTFQWGEEEGERSGGVRNTASLRELGRRATMGLRERDEKPPKGDLEKTFLHSRARHSLCRYSSCNAAVNIYAR